VFTCQFEQPSLAPVRKPILAFGAELLVSDETVRIDRKNGEHDS
jgi:hypothetical protein